MVAGRRVITLSIDPDQYRALVSISRSRIEATGRVGAGSHNPGLSRDPIGLRRRAADRGDPADGDGAWSELRNWGPWPRSMTGRESDAML
jgi:hypothetical protein